MIASKKRDELSPEQRAGGQAFIDGIVESNAIPDAMRIIGERMRDPESGTLEVVACAKWFVGSYVALRQCQIKETKGQKVENNFHLTQIKLTLEQFKTLTPDVQHLMEEGQIQIMLENST